MLETIIIFILIASYVLFVISLILFSYFYNGLISWILCLVGIICLLPFLFFVLDSSLMCTSFSFMILILKYYFSHTKQGQVFVHSIGLNVGYEGNKSRLKWFWWGFDGKSRNKRNKETSSDESDFSNDSNSGSFGGGGSSGSW